MKSPGEQVIASLDGPLFRRQRLLLLALAKSAGRSLPFTFGPDDRELLEGLISFTDAVADIAHDGYGLECLLDE